MYVYHRIIHFYVDINSMAVTFTGEMIFLTELALSPHTDISSKPPSLLTRLENQLYNICCQYTESAVQTLLISFEQCLLRKLPGTTLATATGLCWA